jgi:hypothetical protein
MPFAEIQRLPPPIDTPQTDTVLRPTVEFSEVTSSYLDFLRNQIRLKPRGEEWAEVLRARLFALVPYENATLYFVSILRMDQGRIESFYARFHPGDFRMIHAECA